MARYRPCRAPAHHAHGPAWQDLRATRPSGGGASRACQDFRARLGRVSGPSRVRTFGRGCASGAGVARPSGVSARGKTFGRVSAGGRVSRPSGVSAPRVRASCARPRVARPSGGGGVGRWVRRGGRGRRGTTQRVRARDDDGSHGQGTGVGDLRESELRLRRGIYGRMIPFLRCPAHPVAVLRARPRIGRTATPRKGGSSRDEPTGRGRASGAALRPRGVGARSARSLTPVLRRARIRTARAGIVAHGISFGRGFRLFLV